MRSEVRLVLASMQCFSRVGLARLGGGGVKRGRTDSRVGEQPSLVSDCSFGFTEYSPTNTQLSQGVLRIRSHTFGLRNVGSRYSMKSKLTVPNVVCGFFNAEPV